MFQRSGPVLDADVFAEYRVEGVGDVAGGEDVRVARTQARVDEDAVVDGQAGGLSQVGVRDHAHRHQDDIGRNDRVIRQSDAGRSSILRGDLGDRCPQAHFHVMLAVEPGEHLGDLRPEHSQQRQVGRLDDSDIESGLACGGGDFHADPAGSDDNLS